MTDWDPSKPFSVQDLDMQFKKMRMFVRLVWYEDRYNGTYAYYFIAEEDRNNLHSYEDRIILSPYI